MADEEERHSDITGVFDRISLMDAVARPNSRKTHVLVRLDGSDVGQVFTLSGEEMRFGRHPDNHLHFPQDGVSRRHGRFVRDGETYRVEDYDSANGTFVGGQRVRQHSLKDGDVVQIGPRLVFRYSATDTNEEQMLRQLYEASVKDSLTGAHNREYLNERLRAEVAYARRHGTETSLVLLDIDFFKRINDTHGHLAGDAVLITLSRRLSRLLRTEDVFARYGGEEFAVSLRGIDLFGAQRVGERLRLAVASAPVEHGGTRIECTISAGCATLKCGTEATVEALIGVADRRLYAAKRGGRNRVVASG